MKKRSIALFMAMMLEQPHWEAAEMQEMINPRRSQPNSQRHQGNR